MRKIAVIGSGNMGAGIAAHIANAGFEVLLYDIVLTDQKNRNFLAEKALAKLEEKKVFGSKGAKSLVSPLNLEDDLSRLKEVDLIIEAITEDIELKYNLYQKIDKYKAPDSLISSNTSTISLQKLIKKMPEKFQKKFFITHFFNPPRHMKLLELVSHSLNEEADIKNLKEFCFKDLGKEIIDCYDSPGFIANRIGCYFLELSMREAIKHNILPSLLDQAMIQYLKMPKTAIFGLYDLIGLDLMKLISQSLIKSLPESDDYAKEAKEYPKFYLEHLKNNYIGRKGKGGFYRLNEGKKQQFNFFTNEFVDIENDSIKEMSLKEFLSQKDDLSLALGNIIFKFLHYVLMNAENIAEHPSYIDQAMKTGYNWKITPFQLIKILGKELIIKEFKARNLEIPEMLEKLEDKYREMKTSQINSDSSGLLCLSEIKDKSKSIYASGSTELWDLGDDVCCLELKSKMNVLNIDVMESIIKIVDYINDQNKKLVIASEQNYFSVGADLQYILKLIESKNYHLLEEYILIGQKALNHLASSNAKVVSAVIGHCLGGGCELMMHSNQSVVHIESYIGLTETKLGLLPAWGGCQEIIAKNSNNLKLAIKNVFQAKISNSAREAREMGLIDSNDKIIMNDKLLLSEAKKAALEPKIIRKFQNKNVDSGKYSREEIKLHLDVQENNQVIFEHLFRIFFESEAEKINDLERKIFLELVKKEQVVANIKEIIKK